MFKKVLPLPPPPLLIFSPLLSSSSSLFFPPLPPPPLLLLLFKIEFLIVALAVLEGTHSVNRAGLEHGDLPVSVSQMLGLKVCATTATMNGMVFNSLHNSQLASAILCAGPCSSVQPVYEVRDCRTFRTWNLY